MKTAKLFTLFIVALISAINAFSQQNAQKIDALVKQYHDYGQFNGSVLVAEKGKIIYEKGFGLANMEWAIPNQPDTNSQSAPLTKQFTARVVRSSSRKADQARREDTDICLTTGKIPAIEVTIHQLSITPRYPSYTNRPFLRRVQPRSVWYSDFVKKFA